MSNPGTFGDRWQPMTLLLDLKIGIAYQYHRVADADFDIGGQRCIWYCNDATMLVDSQTMVADAANVRSAKSSAKSRVASPIELKKLDKTGTKMSWQHCHCASDINCLGFS
jgi:hypothetical protein